MQEVYQISVYADKCRVCLLRRKGMHSLFRPCDSTRGDDGGGGCAPAESLSRACGMHISPRDGGPAFICSACRRNLDATLVFLRKCERAERLLSTLLHPENRKDSIIIGDDVVKAEITKENKSSNIILGVKYNKVKKYKRKSRLKHNSEDGIVFYPRNLCKTTVEEGKTRRRRAVVAASPVGTAESPRAAGDGVSVTCEVCGRRMRSAAGLRVHLRLHAGDARPHSCHLCDKNFAKKDNLAVHIRRHMKQRTFSCEVCGAAHYTAHELRTHSRTHTGVRPHTCDVCGRTFTASNNLYIHQRTHTGEKPHECDTCGKKFISRNILNIHQRTHTGEKPYVCPVCGKRFASNKLAAHARTHTGERPHVCSICGRRFAARGALHTHMRRHTGHERYTCAVCGQRYAHTQSLNKHTRRHHPTAPAPPPSPPPSPPPRDGRAVADPQQADSDAAPPAPAAPVERPD